jgi:wyosine [tRNA(Phe)-imidazoG37] synthetase (radical SAM superfamily)
MTKNRNFRYVFGPVPSRRLGRSLGVDLVPFKTCSYDCVYCQLGRTTSKTVTLSEYVPVADVLSELDSRLSTGIQPDYITLSGSGEPTLNSAIGRLIEGIKRRTRIPVAVLTNGSLLWREEVRNALLSADLVIPSIDAGDDRLFQYVNRPHASLGFEQVVTGIRRFRQDFRHRMWLEVFLLSGVTTVTADLENIRDIVEQISPDRVQLNTVDRPPSEAYAYRVSHSVMKSCARILGERAEIISRNRTWKDTKAPAHRAEIIELLKRRPCTAEDIAHGIGDHRAEVVKWLETMLREGEMSCRRINNQDFYSVEAHCR